MFHKRWVLIGALLFAALFVLAACGSGEVQTVIVTEIVEGEPVEVVVTVPPADTGDEGSDTIIVCMSQEPDSLYAMVSTMAVTGRVLMATDLHGWVIDRGFFYETQALVNDEFPTFESGDVVIDGEGADAVMSITYRFKDNITWSDGEPFTVDDLLYTREVLIDPDSGATTRGGIDQETWTKVDDYTLTRTLPAGVLDPTYFLPPLSTAENGSIAAPLPEHVLGDMTPAEIVESDYARAPNPTLGAYEVVEWVEGDNIRLQAVDGWWGGEAETPNLVYRFISDTNQLLASLLSGECDFATDDGLQLTQLPFIQQSADQGLIAYDALPALVWEHIDFNTAPPATAENNGYGIWADKLVRQAVAYGTNRTEMTEQILYGEVEPLTSYLPADHWAYNPAVADLYPYDPDQARALLAEAGYEDSDGDGFVEAASNLGGDLTCSRGTWEVPAGTVLEGNFHTTTGNAMREQLVTLFQAHMAEVGIKINIDLLPASVWFADDGPLFTRTYQIGEFAWVSGPDPSGVSTYLGQNVYKTPEGSFTAASTILEENPDLLGELGLTAAEFVSGRPTEDQLGDYVLSQVDQIPDEADNYEGQNNLAWCNTAADQAIFDADNVIAPEERLPFFLEFQLLMAEDVPTLPLFQRVNVNGYAVNLCGSDLGPANTVTWNVEDWYFGDCGE
jgi:peptide/nickel transport system substrate-binding protein